MAIYDRNKGLPNAKKNLWFSYSVTEELRVRYGLKTRTVREPSPEDNERVAKAALAQRRREVVDGTWAPRSEGGSASGKLFSTYAEEWIARRTAAGVKSIRNERQRLRHYVVPVLGSKRVGEIRRGDVVALVAKFMTTPLPTTEELPAPRMVHRVYEDVRTMFASLVDDETLLASPCTLKVKRGELPKKRDKNPRWRSSAVFAREEVEELISDERIPLFRRTTYALLFLTGSRIGEVSGMLWRDYEPKLLPLGRLVVATTYGGSETKTEVPRQVPVHPVLAAILAEWRLEFPLHFGRALTLDDYIVPRLRTRGGKPAVVPYQDYRRVWVNLQADLKTLGRRGRRTHDGRRTFISLARTDKADKSILDWITHGPSESDMQDLYTTFPWEAFCEEMAKLRIQRRRGAEIRVLRPLESASF